MGASAFSTRTVFGALHGNENSQTVIYAFIILSVSAIVFATGGIFAQRISEKLGQSYAIEFRKNFYSHLALLPKSTLSKKRVGALSIRFVGDLGAMREWASRGLTGIISASLVIPSAALVLWKLEPTFAQIGLIAIFASFLCMTILGWSHSKVQASIRRERANISIDMMERVSVAPDLRLLGRLNKDFRLLDRRGEELADAAVERTKKVEILKAIPDVFLGLAAVMLLWVTVRQGLEAGTAAASLATISIISVYMKDLARVWDMWCAWKIARDKSQIIFDMETVKHSKRGKSLPNQPVSIKVENLLTESFGPLSLDIAPASRTLLQGTPNIVTRMSHLIAGFEKPVSGEIYYSDYSRQKIAQRSFAKRIMTLSLTSPILQGSLRRNLTLGCKKRPTDETILKAIEKYRLIGLFNRLEGLDGRIDEAGKNLSNAEVLRLLIVRAELAKPKLIIIDLPVASYDVQDQKLCFSFVTGLKATIIFACGSTGWDNVLTDKIKLQADGLNTVS